VRSLRRDCDQEERAEQVEAASMSGLVPTLGSRSGCHFVIFAGDREQSRAIHQPELYGLCELGQTRRRFAPIAVKYDLKAVTGR
jgi:hypothetical protein